MTRVLARADDRRNIMRNRLIGAAAVAAASAIVLSGCSGDDAGSAEDVDFTAAPSGTLAAWGFENADDVGTARLDYAAEQMPDVEVQLDATAFDSQKFTTRIASGDVPDVVQMDRRYVTQYAAQGLIMPLDSCYDAREVDADDRWYESVVDDVRYDDQVWGAPQFYQPPAIILNKRVMDAAGVTAAEIDTSQPDVLLGAIEKMYVASGGVPTRLGFDPVSTGQSALWILGSGGQLTDDDGVPTLDDPSNLAGMELLQRINDAQGGFAQVKSFTDAFDTFGDANQYVTDQVGAQVNAQWYPNVLSPYIDEIDIEAVPFRDSEGEPFSVSGGQAFVIPMNAKNPAAACAWVSELTSPEAWNAAGEARAETRASDGGANTGLFTGSPEPDRSIREQWVTPSGDAGFDQVVATYYDVVDYGSSFGSSPAGQDIQNELNNAVTAALLGDKTAEEALADAQGAAMRAYDNATANG
ncbi:ABC transporter substrate-binding protein [Microbacterium radiodurans]|nr:extracellular solute-binding protein [Microbacterium radiodurans]